MNRPKLRPVFLIPLAGLLPGSVFADLLISQYYEGSSGNNKYIELTNTSSADLDLTGYIVTSWSNDNTESFKVAGNFPTNEVSLSGTLAAGATYLIANPSSAVPIPAGNADLTSEVTFINGNDSVVLYEGGTIDPGNIADALSFTDDGSEGRDTSFVRQNTAAGYNLTPGSSVLDFSSVWQQVSTDEVINASFGEDNFLGSSALGSISPLVRFTSGSALVVEGDGTAELEVEIRVPDGEAVSVDLVLDEASSTLSTAELGDYTTQTVTFPAGAADGDTRTVTISLTDDAEAEPTEVAVFELTNLVTSGDALLSGTTSFELSVQDDDTVIAPIYLSEIADPGDDFNARFVEIFNPTAETIDLSAGGWTIVYFANDNQSGRDIPLTGIIQPGGTYVIAHEAEAYALAYPDAPLPDQISDTINSNGDDNIELRFGGENGPLVDLYGSPGTDGTDQPWEFLDSQVVRTGNGPNSTFTIEEWTITPAVVADMTPGTHSGSAPVAQLEIVGFSIDPETGQVVISATGLGTKIWAVQVSDDLDQDDPWSTITGGVAEQDQPDGSTNFVFSQAPPLPVSRFYRLVEEN